MCCSYSLIHGTEPPFKLSTVLNLSTTKRALPNASFRLICNTQFPILSTKTRIHSFRTKAAINDGFVKTEPSFYDLLGIPETGSLIEIKQAYKQMARKYHPDVSPPGRVEEYTKRFIRVQEAYETLSDPSRRALYDRDMSRGIHLAFSARKRYQNVEETNERGGWKNRWQGQVSELKRRSMEKEAGGNMSWAARMRRQRKESSSEL